MCDFFHFMTFFYLCEQEIFSFIRVCYYNIMHLSPHDFYIEMYIQSLIFFIFIIFRVLYFYFFQKQKWFIKKWKAV